MENQRQTLITRIDYDKHRIDELGFSIFFLDKITLVTISLPM